MDYGTGYIDNPDIPEIISSRFSLDDLMMFLRLFSPNGIFNRICWTKGNLNHRHAALSPLGEGEILIDLNRPSIALYISLALAILFLRDLFPPFFFVF